MSLDLSIEGGPVIPAEDLSWTAVRSSGPGGQNVNKVATKVVLRFDLRNTTALTPRVKTRLRKLARGKLDAEGRVVISSQATRFRARNLEDARGKLAELIAAALVEPKQRRATKPSRAAKRRRLDDKRRTSEKKQGRGRLQD
jgi:ribosome-associated protein